MQLLDRACWFDSRGYSAADILSDDTEISLYRASNAELSKVTQHLRIKPTLIQKKTTMKVESTTKCCSFYFLADELVCAAGIGPHSRSPARVSGYSRGLAAELVGTA